MEQMNNKEETRKLPKMHIETAILMLLSRNIKKSNTSLQADYIAIKFDSIVTLPKKLKFEIHAKNKCIIKKWIMLNTNSNYPSLIQIPYKKSGPHNSGVHIL